MALLTTYYDTTYYGRPTSGATTYYGGTEYLLLTTADQPQAPLLTMAPLNTCYLILNTYYLLMTDD